MTTENPRGGAMINEKRQFATFSCPYSGGGYYYCGQRVSDPAGHRVFPRSLVGAADYSPRRLRGCHRLAVLEKPARHEVVKELPV